MIPSRNVQRACRILRARVRYANAGLYLPGNETIGKHDTVAIQHATRLYTESWIVPLLDAIETGDTASLGWLLNGSDTQHKEGEPFDLPPLP